MGKIQASVADDANRRLSAERKRERTERRAKERRRKINGTEHGVAERGRRKKLRTSAKALLAEVERLRREHGIPAPDDVLKKIKTDRKATARMAARKAKTAVAANNNFNIRSMTSEEKAERNRYLAEHKRALDLEHRAREN